MQECEEVFVLLGDEGRVSRHFRSIWLLDNLYQPVSTEERTTDDGSFTILSATRAAGGKTLPSANAPDGGKTAQDAADGDSQSLLHIGPNTQVTFFSPRYCLVFMLDVSPSMLTVDTLSGRVLFDELFLSVAQCLRKLSQPFKAPGSKRSLEPDLYISVLAAQTVAKHQPVQSILLQGTRLTRWNVETVIDRLEEKLLDLENLLAEHAAQASSTAHGEDPCDSEYGLVAMLRSGHVGLQLLPDGAADSLILVTDTVCGMSDGAATEVLMTQLRNFDITFSCFQLGSKFHAGCSFGFVPNKPLLQFIPLATSGAYLANVEQKQQFEWNEKNGELNFYQRCLLGWRCQYNSEDWQHHYSAVNVPQSNRFWSDLPLVPTSRRRYGECDVRASLINVVGTRIRQGYQLANIVIRKRNEGSSRLEVRLLLPWKDRASISYEASADYPLITANTHVDIYIEGIYDIVRDVCNAGNIRASTVNPHRMVVVRRFLQHIKSLQKADQLLVHLLSFNNSPSTYALTARIKSGSSVFYLPPNSEKPIPSSSTGSAGRTSSGQGRHARAGPMQPFTSFWQPVLSLDTGVWHCWFHVQRITAQLLHDSPLSRYLHLHNAVGRYGTVLCRQAAGQVITMLREWSSFVLLEMHSYVRFIESDGENAAPKSFCLVRIAPKNPFFVLRLAFLVGTPPKTQHEMVRDLKERMSKLSLSVRQPRPRSPVLRRQSSITNTPRRPSRSAHVTASIPCARLLNKNYEKILMRYEMIPSNIVSATSSDCLFLFSAAGTSDAAAPVTGVNIPHGLGPHMNTPMAKTAAVAPTTVAAVGGSSGSGGFTWSRSNLACHLFQQRWVWCMEQPSSSSVSGILATLVELRLQQGFSFALSHSITGIISMTCQLMVEVTACQDESRRDRQPNATNASSAQVDAKKDTTNTRSAGFDKAAAAAQSVKLPCLLQYVLFPPLNHHGVPAAAVNGVDMLSPSTAVGSGPLCLTDAATVDNGITTAAAAAVAASAAEQPSTAGDVSSQDGASTAQGLRIVSELWIEPQEGRLCDLPRGLRSLKGLSYENISDQLIRDDLNVVSALCSYEQLLLMCEFPDKVSCPESASPAEVLARIADSKPIAHLPSLFDLPLLIGRGHIVQVNLSGMEQSTVHGHLSSLGSLLFSLFFSKLAAFNDRRIPLSATTSAEVVAKLLRLSKEECEAAAGNLACNLCCFIKSRVGSCLHLTILPASLADAQRLHQLQRYHTGVKRAGSASINVSCIPVFVVECSLSVLQLTKTDKNYQPVCLDFTFPKLDTLCNDVQRKPGWLISAVVRGWQESSGVLLTLYKELSMVCMAMQELYMTAYLQTVFASLQRGAAVSRRDVAWAMGLCDQSVNVPVDVSTFLSACCSHCRVASSSKGKGNRAAESPFVHKVSALPHVSSLPGTFSAVMPAASSRLDRLTQRSMEHALLPSTSSMPTTSDWSQESDTGTSDTDRSAAATAAAPSICQVHQAGIQEQFKSDLAANFTSISSSPNYFFFSTSDRASTSSKSKRRRSSRLKKEFHVDGGAADVESASSGNVLDDDDDNEDGDGSVVRDDRGVRASSSAVPGALASTRADSKFDDHRSPTAAKRPTDLTEVKSTDLNTSQQLRDMRWTIAGSPTAPNSGSSRKHRARYRQSTMCADAADASSSDSSDNEENKRAVSVIGNRSSSVNVPSSKVISSSPFFSSFPYSSVGSSGVEKSLADNGANECSGDELNDDNLRPLFLSLYCCVSTLNPSSSSSINSSNTGAGTAVSGAASASGAAGVAGAGGTGSVAPPGGANAGSSSLSVPSGGSAAGAATGDTGTECSSVSFQVSSLPTCFEDIIRDWVEHRARAGGQDHDGATTTTTSTPLPLQRNMSFGVSLDLFCQFSSLLDDTASVGSGGLLNSLVCSARQEDTNALDSAVHPGGPTSPTPPLDADDVTSAEAFIYSPRVPPLPSSAFGRSPSHLRSSNIEALPPEQSAAIEATKEKVEWLLHDEIVSAAHRSEPLLAGTLEMAVRHVVNSRGRQISSCREWNVPLRFVGNTTESLSRFIKEFEKLPVPGYGLRKLDDFYYLKPSGEDGDGLRTRAGSLTSNDSRLARPVHATEDNSSGSRQRRQQSTNRTRASSTSPVRELSESSSALANSQSSVFSAAADGSVSSTSAALSTALSALSAPVSSSASHPTSPSRQISQPDSSLSPSSGSRQAGDKRSSYQAQTSRASGSSSMTGSPRGSPSKHLPSLALHKGAAVPLASPFFRRMEQQDTADSISLDNVSVTTDGYGYLPDDITTGMSDSDADADAEISPLVAPQRQQRRDPKRRASVSSNRQNRLLSTSRRDERDADYIPEFWLILRVYENRLGFYHQYRNSESLSSKSFEQLRQICDLTSDFVRESEKVVNQWLLLLQMFETKQANPLLVPEDFMPSVTGWQATQQQTSDDRDSEGGNGSDRSSAISRTGRNMRPGLFECPLQHTLHVPIHPRLSSSPGQSSSSSPALQIVHAALAYFSVTNREKLYVYREHTEGSDSGIFYLCVFESLCGVEGLSKAPSWTSLNSSNVTWPSRSSTSTPAPGFSSAGIVQDVADDYGSVGRGPSRLHATSISNLQQMEQRQSVMVHVHGIQEPGPDIKEELLTMLKKRLEEATLKGITDMLHRNIHSTIYPPDVMFLQPVGQPPHKFCRFVLPPLPCQHRHSFMYYLRQHLLQFMIIPKYAESDASCHLLPFCRPARPVVDLLNAGEDFVLLFNSRWAVGLGCVALVLLLGSGATFNMADSEPKCTCPPGYQLPGDLTPMLEVTPVVASVPANVDCIDISIWEHGTIGMDTLVERVHQSIKFALADFVMEHFIMPHPLATLPGHIQQLVESSLATAVPQPHTLRPDAPEVPATASSLRSEDGASPLTSSANSSMVIIPSSELLEMSTGEDLPEPAPGPDQSSATHNHSLSDEQLRLLADSQLELSNPRLSTLTPGSGTDSFTLDDRTSGSVMSGVDLRNVAEALTSPGGRVHTERISFFSAAQWHGKAERGQCGNLHPAYSQHFLKLVRLGHNLSSNSFFSTSFDLPVRNLPASALQDLIRVVDESGAGVASVMFHEINTASDQSDDVLFDTAPHSYFVPYNPARVAMRQSSNEPDTSCVEMSSVTRMPPPPSSYLLIAHNHDQWRWWRLRSRLSSSPDAAAAVPDTAAGMSDTAAGGNKEPGEKDPAGQNFKSFSNERSYQAADSVAQVGAGIVLPRQQLIMLAICGKKIELYSYNASQDVITRLKRKLEHIAVWHELRTSFLNSLLTQKMGLFRHATLESITSTGRESFGLQGHFIDMELVVKETAAPSRDHVRQQQSRWQRSLNSGAAGHLQNYELLYYGTTEPSSTTMDKKPFATETDPVKRHGLQAQERFSVQRRASARQIKLSDLFEAWQRRQTVHAPVNEDLLESMKRACRLYHYCASPLLFHEQSRKSLLHSLQPRPRPDVGDEDKRESRAEADSASLKAAASAKAASTSLSPKHDSAYGKAPVPPVWLQTLHTALTDSYVEYLEAPPLSFTRIIVKTRTTHGAEGLRRKSKAEGPPGSYGHSRSSSIVQRVPSPLRSAASSPSPSSLGEPRTICLQKTTAGGIIMIELCCKTGHFVVKLYALEGSIIQPQLTSNEQLSTLFMQECSRMKDFIHVHSFTYDIHLRLAMQLLKEETSILPREYDVVDMLGDFIALRKQPTFCQNRIMQDEINVPVPSTATPEQLFTYMLAHAPTFRMDVLEQPEQVTSSLPGCGGTQIVNEDRIRTSLLVVDECFLPENEIDLESGKRMPDFHRCLLVMLPQAEADVQHISVEAFSGSGGYDMTLKFYLLLTSVKHPFPMLRRATNIAPSQWSAASRIPGDDSPDVSDLTFRRTVQEQWRQMGYASHVSTEPPSSSSQSESSESRLTDMDIFMDSQMKLLGGRLKNVVSRASEHCRRDTLWKRMLYGQSDLLPRRTGRMSTESTDVKWEATVSAGLSAEEMEELIPKVTCISLVEVDAALAPLFLVNGSGISQLLAVLKQHYGDYLRTYKSANGAITHAVILNSEWQDMVILLTLKASFPSIASHAVYRRARTMAPPPTIEALDGEQGDADHVHIQSVINTLAFCSWSDLFNP
ncbi:KICSTOR complex protein SZT2-like [Sycon ciliatum]|uniref:KICSTOR complex protein SZT2-like n=1 Tax=Sycon ciliatum TaxID=27933 RepID=UPI0031F712A6